MIQVRNLSFSYSRKEFIKNMSFNVNKGEIFGFLGPSGAGKSTIQKILTGYINHYDGEVIVNNQETKHINRSFYEHIGVDFEFPSLYEKLTGLQNLEFFASLYKKHRECESLLKKVGLDYDSSKEVSEYSKGMKSRLNFIKSLVHDPDILFLDEPTSGLDPTNASIVKKMILEEKKKGKTILLTTHDMYTAQELCDRVAFIVDGKIMELDSPHQLIMTRGAKKLVYSYKENNQEITKEVMFDHLGSDNVLLEMIKTNRITFIHSLEPTLNDIFIEVTGKNLL